MKVFRLVCCVTAAIVGAGFASGREIMRFFAGYGQGSWLLIAVASAAAALMMHGMMAWEPDSVRSPGGWRGRALRAGTTAAYAAVAGAMAAAAGELAALTLPVRHARAAGTLLTLGGCVLLSRRALQALKWMGAALFPLTVCAYALCARVPGGEAAGAAAALSPEAMPLAAAGALCYSAMNVMLSAGVLWEAGKQCTPRQQKAAALGGGIALGSLLALGNAALLPRAASLSSQALPTVYLLRAYGKAGFYLAAAVLYTAVVTTLISVLRSMEAWLGGNARRRGVKLFFLPALCALMGFGGLVAYAYPLLGGAALAGMATRACRRRIRNPGTARNTAPG